MTTPLPPPDPSARASREDAPATGAPAASHGPGRSPGRPAPDVTADRGRPPLLRDADDRVLAGVAAGVARVLGTDPLVVRVAFVGLSLAGGVGIALYLLAWTYSQEPAADDPPPATATARQAWAIGLITFGVMLLLRDIGVWFGDAIVLPLVLALLGSAVLWVRSEDGDRRRWASWRAQLPGLGGDARTSPARLVIGLLLVAVGLTTALATTNALLALRSVGLALAVGVVGLALVVGPWIAELLRDLDQERRERIRTEERAEVAAHLHDSVLQTLALIQRSSDQPRRMVALARSQERDLRAWLYGRRDIDEEEATLRGLLDAVLVAVESSHELDVDLVVVGDTAVDDDVRALVAAIREALTNAGRHSGADAASVYLEVESDEVTAFVRDRGRGFDPASVAPDRRGVADSIRGRLARHGGYATLRTAPGQGTEWELVVPADGIATDVTPTPAAAATTAGVDDGGDEPTAAAEPGASWPTPPADTVIATDGPSDRSPH